MVTLCLCILTGPSEPLLWVYVMETSIFTVELSAIILALKLMFVHQSNNFTLFCDLQGDLLVLETFNSPHSLDVAALE